MSVDVKMHVVCLHIKKDYARHKIFVNLKRSAKHTGNFRLPKKILTRVRYIYYADV